MKDIIKTVAINRGPLNFFEEVKKNFAFLESKYDFMIAESLPTYVRYESPKMFINIYHGRISYEIGLEFGRLDSEKNQKDCYSLWALINLFNENTAKKYRLFAARTSELVKKGVAELSQLFKQYENFIFIDGETVFDKLLLQREQLGKEYEKEVYTYQVRSKVEVAFKAKNFSEVVRLYESILDRLTPLEIKKLEYAKKH